MATEKITKNKINKFLRKKVAPVFVGNSLKVVLDSNNGRSHLRAKLMVKITAISYNFKFFYVFMFSCFCYFDFATQLFAES